MDTTFWAGTLAIGTTGALVWWIQHLLWQAGEKAGWERPRLERFRRQLLAVVLGWLALTGLLAAGGLLRFDTRPPSILPVLAVPLVALPFVLRAQWLRELLPHLTQEVLLGTQVFRVPVELFLWLLFVVGVVPVQMTFEQYNWDVLTGLTAIPVAVLLRRAMATRWIWLWNLLGLALLLNIVTIALLSAPLPIRQFHNEPANTFIATFPFVWLPAFLVPCAYYLHALSLRKAALRQ